MVFKKKKGSRRSSGKKKRRSRPKTVPFEMLIAGASIPFVPRRPGHWTLMQYINAKEYQNILPCLADGFLGYNKDYGWNIMGAINPFDMENAPYSKMLFWSAIIGKVRKRLAPQSSRLFRKIPIIGRWVS